MNASQRARAGARRKGGGGPDGCALSFTGGACACDSGTPPCCATRSAAAAAAGLAGAAEGGIPEGTTPAGVRGEGAGARGRNERPPDVEGSSRCTGQSLRAIMQHLPVAIGQRMSTRSASRCEIGDTKSRDAVVSRSRTYDSDRIHSWDWCAIRTGSLGMEGLRPHHAPAPRAPAGAEQCVGVGVATCPAAAGPRERCDRE